MKAKDYRQSAWKSLSGKWGTCVLAYLIFSLIASACGGMSYYGVGAIAGIILLGPLTYGMSKISLFVARDKDVELGMLFNGFNDFGRALVLYITNNIFVFLWSLLLIVPGIIKQIAYSMSFYIMLDDPKISANDARKKSIEMMQGNKWRFFCLELSFIGWYLLSILTLGILMFWVGPYMETAKAKFYMSLLPEQENQDGFDNSDFVDMSRVDLDADNNFGRNDFDFFSEEENNRNNGNSQREDFDFSDDEFK